MSWHNVNKSNDGLVCSMCESKAYKHIDDTWLDFLVDLQNVRLG